METSHEANEVVARLQDKSYVGREIEELSQLKTRRTELRKIIIAALREHPEIQNDSDITAWRKLRRYPGDLTDKRLLDLARKYCNAEV